MYDVSQSIYNTFHSKLNMSVQSYERILSFKMQTSEPYLQSKVASLWRISLKGKILRMPGIKSTIIRRCMDYFLIEGGTIREPQSNLHFFFFFWSFSVLSSLSKKLSCVFFWGLLDLFLSGQNGGGYGAGKLNIKAFFWSFSSNISKVVWISCWIIWCRFWICVLIASLTKDISVWKTRLIYLMFLIY